ncbi:M56 family peptidase, partial [Streptomyces hyaluromycini]
AASAVGDRRLTARAIARAALAGQGGGVERPAFVPGAATGPVPQRVQALLAAPRVRRWAGAWVAVLLVACAGLSCAASATGMIDFHHRVEVAQGEAER